MPLQATSGAASYDAFGGGVPSEPNYIESVFQTYLYSGNGSTQTITNSIDLAGQGGLLWIKARNVGGAARNNRLWTTNIGGNKVLQSDSTAALYDYGSPQVTFNSNGFGLSSDAGINFSGDTFASWTFRKQPKFFDVVTYTGNGTARTIAHSLGSVPGCIIVKMTDNTQDWVVYHRSQGNTKVGSLNLTSAFTTGGAAYWNNTTPTSTVFSLGNDISVNQNGRTYVAYLFAHDAGGFGLTGTDNVISCGSYTTDGSGNFSVNLGYEPQWIMAKRVSSTGDWTMFDTMRGLGVDGTSYVLYANVSNAESGPNNFMSINSTGFGRDGGTAGQTFIYIAIRRGPMKVPTLGTTVFGITTAVGTSPMYQSSFPVDVALRKQITGGDNYLHSRLQGAKTLYTNYNFAEDSDSNVTWDYQNGMFTTTGANSNQYGWLMKRAPSFMDVVCYTGLGYPTALTANHNLGVAPEMMIVKNRSNTQSWFVYHSAMGNNQEMYLNQSASQQLTNFDWNSTTPSATTFTVNSSTNNSGQTYVAYLFASCAGVSKVGSYTGNGSTQTIDCGFASGARFVLIKRYDSTSNWYVYDTARGMTTLTDPYLLLNSTAAESATLGSVTTVSTGFALNAGILAAINTNGASYIFLAIA